MGEGLGTLIKAVVTMSGKRQTSQTVIGVRYWLIR